MRSEPVLVTGSTGYVGSRLVSLLLASGYRVRAVGRSLQKMHFRPWSKVTGLEMARADMLDIASLSKAAEGCWAAFYLVHSMNSRQKDFAEADRKAAKNMSLASERAGLERIVYLGGLGEMAPDLSKHLKSRMEVAAILQSGRVPATFLRAAMILGAGSASFEILRYLVERLPVMVTPRWVANPVQPIAVSNVLFYLQGCLQTDETVGGTFDIGGPDVLTYERLMEIYAQAAGLTKRRIIGVPVLTPRLSSYWINLVTPVPSFIARPLAEGLRNPVICQDDRIRTLIPQDLLTCREAVKRALGRGRAVSMPTCGSEAAAIPVPELLQCGDPPYAGGTVLNTGFRVILRASPEEVWDAAEAWTGGKGGGFTAPLFWRLPGLVDRLARVGGLRKGRRPPLGRTHGNAMNFFRVLAAEPPHLLRLLTEMKSPGETTLTFRIRPLKSGRTELSVLARYVPRGLMGLLCGYILSPFHKGVYGGMIEGLVSAVGKPVLSGPDRFVPGRYPS